ncbi:CYTH domain-containing protein [Flavobacterium agricola]|uniref:CYTH domain-containing protein n=1 Tax=Flavobacterium agricola TaxID=2870839 RepID=A0ABY6LY13_9FLAO|nr:CYTH domain-containing protein [Flavobacterium agricola]UYW00872.1 CYTH domain-containing protein [Flavobacterium agricola]
MSATIEIEKKYTVKDTVFLTEKYSSEKIIQGYLSTDSERVVRVRVKGNKGFITIKGKSFANGTSRFEWEKEIEVAEVLALLPLCLPGVINKTRYLVPYNNQMFEVDVFEDENQGLVLAELELQNAQQIIDLPDWIAEEVTQDARYYNAYLTQHPFTTW